MATRPSRTRRSRRSGLGMLAIVWIAVTPALAPAAEPPRPPPIVPFPGPGDFFQRLFGEETEEDRKKLEAIEISPKREQEYGASAVRAYLDHLKRQGIRVVSRGKDVAYVRDLIETIRPLMSNPQRYPSIKVYLAKSSECEARVFPGGSLVLFEGMLETAQSEAALVGILGHELSHLDRGHLLADLRRVRLAEQTFSGRPGPQSPEQFFDVGTLLMRLWTRPFRPEHEAEADRDGARWAYLAGYDPRELAAMFLRARDRANRPRLALPWFLQSHPPPEERHQAVMAVYHQLQEQNPNAALYLGRENLRTRTARSRRKLDE
jgi:predicted Zn-dependent protease